MLHQETNLKYGKDSKRDSNVIQASGIEIKLSRMPLDQNSVGYQKPKPSDDFNGIFNKMTIFSSTSKEIHA